MEKGLKLHRDMNEAEVDPTEYRSIVGKCRHVTQTRPDIAYAVGIVSRYLQNPQVPHLKAAKRIVRYLRTTQDFGVLYKAGEANALTGFTDVDHASCLDEGKSITGYVFRLGSSPITWKSKKQSCVAVFVVSSTKSEYMALSDGSREAIWLATLCKDLGVQQVCPTLIYCDNTSTIKMSKIDVFHSRTKHIYAHFHYIREQLENNRISLQHISTKLQLADIFTKPLERLMFTQLRDHLQVISSQALLC